MLFHYLLFLNTYYLKVEGIDAKLVNPLQFLNAPVPKGVGVLNQIVGAVPLILFVVDVI